MMDTVTYSKPHCFPVRPRVLASVILGEVAERHALPVSVVIGDSRKQPHAFARHEFFYLAIKLSPLSASQIGTRYGFDHSTVLYGAAKHAERNNLRPVTELNLAKRAANNARYQLRDAA